MRVLLVLMSVFAVSCSIVSCSTESKNIAPSIVPGAIRIEVQGHRGARGRFPENSIPALQHALDVGVDTLEFDLGVTKDGELVVAHDPYLNHEQCLGPKGEAVKPKIPLNTLTLAELKTYSCGTLPHPRFAKQKKMKVTYATLREVFDMVKNSPLPIAKTVGFNIETKIVPGTPDLFPTPSEFAGKVISMIHEYGFASRVTLQSFDHRTLVESKKIDSSIRISPLIENTMFTNLPAMAKELKAEIVSPNLFWITQSSVEGLHSIGVRVVPWTANEEKEWAMLVSLGVDGIISDYPEELIAYLKSKGLR